MAGVVKVWQVSPSYHLLVKISEYSGFLGWNYSIVQRNLVDEGIASDWVDPPPKRARNIQAGPDSQLPDFFAARPTRRDRFRVSDLDDFTERWFADDECRGGCKTCDAMLHSDFNRCSR
jgi:hypothetical protein